MLKHSSDIPAEAGNSARFERSDLLTVTKVGIDIVETSPERRLPKQAPPKWHDPKAKPPNTAHLDSYLTRPETLISSARAEDYRDLASAVYRSRPPQPSHPRTEMHGIIGTQQPNSVSDPESRIRAF